MKNRRRPRSRWTCVWFALQLCCLVPAAVAEITPEFLMDSDLELPLPESVQVFPANLTELWMEALDQPQYDMQRMAAETIARGHEHGVPGLEQAVPRLEQILTVQESHPAARYAAARALIVLDARASSDKLLEASQAHGADLRQLIEPALARWDSAPASQMWNQRLGSVETPRRDLILAIRGLSEIGESSALPGLLAIVGDQTRNPDVRLEAAAAAGRIAEGDLEQDARRLVESQGTTPIVDRLCAVRLLARHSSEEAIQLLVELAGQDEPAVAAAALERLNEIDSSLVLSLAGSAVQDSDAKVRRQGIVCLLQNPSAEVISTLSRLLGDPHPDLRRFVSGGLHGLAEKPDLDGPIREAAMSVLAGESWQGQEQASLLLGALEHQPAADRLIELLESPRVEVRIPAAWALRRIADPSTIPDLIDHAQRLTELRKNTEQGGIDEQVAHLFEALGALQAEQAVPLLLQYVPKNVRRNDLSRGAAIWAIGRIYAGKRDEEIENALIDRIQDFAPRPFERPLVKQMCAIGLARMGAVDQAPMLRDFMTSLETDLSESERGIEMKRLEMAVIWAVGLLTGEELPPAQPLTAPNVDWFLEPLP